MFAFIFTAMLIGGLLTIVLIPFMVIGILIWVWWKVAGEPEPGPRTEFVPGVGFVAVGPRPPCCYCDGGDTVPYYGGGFICKDCLKVVGPARIDDSLIRPRRRA